MDQVFNPPSKKIKVKLVKKDAGENKVYLNLLYAETGSLDMKREMGVTWCFHCVIQDMYCCG